MPALLYGFFACYAVTGKCELSTDSQGRDLAVFTSLEDCQRFGSGPAQQRPNSEGKWPAADGHYYQCLSMTPSTGATATTAAVAMTAPAAATASAAATVPGAAASAPAATAAKPPPTSVTPAAPAAPSAALTRTPATTPTSAVPLVAAVPAAAVPATASAPTTAAAPNPDTSRPVYRTTAEALQHDFEVNPDALNRKIGTALVQVSGTVVNRTNLVDGALQLSGGSSDVTAWIEKDEIAYAQSLSRKAYVTLSCDRIGTLVAASARRPGIVEVRDCRLLNDGG